MVKGGGREGVEGNCYDLMEGNLLKRKLEHECGVVCVGGVRASKSVEVSQGQMINNLICNLVCARQKRRYTMWWRHRLYWCILR